MPKHSENLSFSSLLSLFEKQAFVACKALGKVGKVGPGGQISSSIEIAGGWGCSLLGRNPQTPLSLYWGILLPQTPLPQPSADIAFGKPAKLVPCGAAAKGCYPAELLSLREAGKL